MTLTPVPQPANDGEGARPSGSASQEVESAYTSDRAPSMQGGDPVLEAWDQVHEYAVRQGIFLLQSGEKSDPDAAFFSAICDAIRSDSRIHDFQRPPFQPDWSHTYRFVPPLSESSVEDVLADRDDFGVARFGKAIVFRVEVPVEDQPAFRGETSIPTTTYYVAWDGLLVTVLWEQPAGVDEVSHAAGRVIYDLLDAAVDRAGAELRVQACSPGCTNLFMHTDVVMVGSGESPVDGWSRLLVMVVSSHRPPQEEVQIWHERIARSAMVFARMKSAGRRVRDLESLARSGLAFALTQRQKRDEKRREPWKLKIRNAGRRNGWRRNIDETLSDVWLAVARTEQYRREWQEHRLRFLDTSKRANVQALFEIDRADDDSAINSMDLTLIREALEHAGNRLDANMLSLVTGLAAGGGIFGGVVGALVAHAIGS